MDRKFSSDGFISEQLTLAFPDMILHSTILKTKKERKEVLPEEQQ